MIHACFECGVPLWWPGMLDLAQNQPCVIRDWLEYVFVPVKYFYVLTHNCPVQSRRSHSCKGLFRQLSVSQPSASAGSASMNVTATSQHMSRVTTLVHAPEGEWGGGRWLFGEHVVGYRAWRA